MIIAGIGSRTTPEHILKDMERIGKWCCMNNVWVRSGHADGADWAFEKGAQSYCIAYLPWPRFNNHLKSAARTYVHSDNEAARELVSKYHPCPSKLSSGAWRLMARNSYQLLGATLDNPSHAVVCWTKDGKATGGTGQAIRMAQDSNIPVYNLFSMDVEEVLNDLIAIKERLGS